MLLSHQGTPCIVRRKRVVCCAAIISAAQIKTAGLVEPGGLGDPEFVVSRSMYPYGFAFDPRDCILHLQLAALELCQFEIICGVVLLGLGNFVVQGLVALLELCKVRLDGHVGYLLRQISA
jgi:hypothetical protein